MGSPTLSAAAAAACRPLLALVGWSVRQAQQTPVPASSPSVRNMSGSEAHDAKTRQNESQTPVPASSPTADNQHITRSGKVERAKCGNTKLEKHMLLVDFPVGRDGLLHAAGVPKANGLDGLEVRHAPALCPG